MNPPQILLVDDEPNIIKALQRLFFDEDYQVLSAPSGEAALEILNSCEVDLIIADYRMGGMNGIEFFCQVRQMQPDAVRIILSGYADIRALTDAINEGNIYRFIFKPWNDDELKNTIQLALEQKRLVLENRSLAQELQRKNVQLEDFNRQLELQVAQRTQELIFQNRVLTISQEILEHVPVGVVGFSDEGVIIVMNQIACGYFTNGIGNTLEEALPEGLSQRCRLALSSSVKPPDFSAHLNESLKDPLGRSHLVQIHHLSGAETAQGAVMIFFPEGVSASQPVDLNAQLTDPICEPSLN